MDPIDIKTHQFLELLGRDEILSQRKISKSLQVSLGSVNATLKNLSASGLIAKKKLHSNREYYDLTQRGMDERRRLSYIHWKDSTRHYTLMKKKVEELLGSMDRDYIKNIVFFGANEISEIAYLTLLRTDIQLSGIVDERMKGEWFLRHQVQGLESLKRLEFDRILVTVFNQEIKMYPLLLKWIEKIILIDSVVL